MPTPSVFGTLLRAVVSLLALWSTAAFAQSAKTEVLWLGQAATRITTPGGKVIMIAPWLVNNPKTPANFKTLEALGKVDLILVTHAHGDHFGDAATLAKMHNVPIYNAGGLGQTLVALGVLPAAQAQRFGKGGTITPFGPAGVKITGVQAEHASEWRRPVRGPELADRLSGLMHRPRSPTIVHQFFPLSESQA